MKYKDRIPRNIKGEIRFDYDLRHLSWLKVGGAADVLFKPFDIDDLINFCAELPSDIPLQVIGAGSNILINDQGVRGVVVKLGANFNYINELSSSMFCVGAATLNYNIAQWSMSKGLSGFEFLVGIPGTAGGGVAMNAGAYGSEFKDIVVECKIVTREGLLQTIQTKDMGFIYRGCKYKRCGIVIVNVKFLSKKSCDPSQIKLRMDNIMDSRSSSQPIKSKTAGSVFVNPDAIKAWQLIDAVGMRGYSIGGAQVSNQHANFIINQGDATAQDIQNLIEMIRNKVKEKFDITLITEIVSLE